MSSQKIDSFKYFQPPYLYKKIIDYINKNKIETTKYDYSKGSEMFNEIIKNMEDFSKIKGIEIKIMKKNNLEVIYDNFQAIIDWHENFDTNNIRKDHLKFLRDLLFSKKEKKVISNFDSDKEQANENFTVNDFILNYTLKATQKIFKNDFNDKDSDILINIYLYLIFKINEPEFIINLKVLTYTHLYKKKKFKQFISDSLECISNKKKFDNKSLKNLIKEKGEFDEFDIKEVSENVKSFFNKKKENINDILNFFTANKIETNFQNFERLRYKGIPLESIVIDKLKYDNNKIYLFTPKFLITNGFKSKIELNDLEIFNSNNYKVDIFAKFIIEIIDKINESIKENNFSTDYIKKNLIKINEQKFNDYISAKLSYDHLKELQKLILKDAKANNAIGMKLENKEKNKNESKQDQIIESKIQSETEISILSKTLISDFNKKYSNLFEEIIEKKLVNFIEKEKLEYLPNIIFMFNLKIPKINTEKNLLEFESVYLDFFSQDKKYINNNLMYGCKEIDTIFKNCSNKNYNVHDSELFSINLTYIRKKGENIFNYIEDKNFTIKPKSILFGEIKRSFPNSGEGDEFVLIGKIEEKQKIKNYSIDYIDEEDPLYPYYCQLIKLIKKFKYFLNTFKDTLNEELMIHIILLYDTVNMKETTIDFINTITNLTKRILNAYENRIDNNIGDTVFQLVFFDNIMFEEKMIEKNMKGDNNINIEKETQLKNKEIEIQKRENELQNKEAELKKKETELKNKENTLKSKETEVQNKVELQKNKKEITQKDKIINDLSNIIEKQNNTFKLILEINLNPNLTQKEKNEKIDELLKKQIFQ